MYWYFNNKMDCYSIQYCLPVEKLFNKSKSIRYSRQGCKDIKSYCPTYSFLKNMRCSQFTAIFHFTSSSNGVERMASCNFYVYFGILSVSFGFDGLHKGIFSFYLRYQYKQICLIKFHRWLIGKFYSTVLKTTYPHQSYCMKLNFEEKHYNFMQKEK